MCILQFQAMNDRPKSSISSSEESESADSEPNHLLTHQKSKTTITKKTRGTILKEFAATIPGIVRHESKVSIDSDEDVAFLEVPKFLDIEQFLGKSINFDKKTKIKINKIKYVIESTDLNTKPLTLLSDKLQVIHPVTTLQLHERVKQKNKSVHVEVEKLKPPSLPENLKIRHPLFGAEYKNKIVLSEEIEQKLDNLITNSVKKMKKKRKHREKNSEDESTYIKQETTNENGEAIFTLLETHSPGKRKKKKSNKEGQDRTIANSTVISELQLPSFEFDVSAIAQQNELQLKTHESKKKKKEKSFDGSGSEMECSPRKRKLSSISSQSESDARSSVKMERTRDDFEGSSSKKKKKKKAKEETETDSLITDLLTIVKNEIDDNEKIKKNKSHHRQ